MTPKLEALLDHCRAEKSELSRLEQERVSLLLEPATVGREHAIDSLDLSIKELDVNRAKLLHSIAKQTPGYAVALQYAAELFGFDPEVGTIRFNKHHGGSFTFGMSGQPVMAVWVENGEVVRSEPIDW